MSTGARWRGGRAWWRTAQQSLTARDPSTARIWAVIALLGTITTCLTSGLAAGRGLHAPELLASAAVTALSVVLLVLPAPATAPLVVLAPLTGTLTVLWLDLLSLDAGVTGQVFFAVPVVWAASQLRLGGVIVVTASTIAADAVVATSLLPRGQALTDLGYMTTLLLLIAGVLARAALVQARLVERLRVLADVDALTGLVTRRVLHEATQLVLEDPSTPAALVVVDLDAFKTVNDTYGHQAGDAALQHVAAVLTTQCRDGDVVARLGGDELAVLLVACPADVAADRAGAFVAAVRRSPLRLPDGRYADVTVSAGLACHPGSGSDSDQLHARADAALYQAKRAGRDQFARA